MPQSGWLSNYDVKPDEQPSFPQIESARKNYNLVREKSQEIRLITDATFNEGGLIERVAENPEGVVEHYLSFDKNKMKFYNLPSFLQLVLSQASHLQITI